MASLCGLSEREYLMSKEVLITGGGGFVGSNFEDAFRLTRANCDLMNLEETIQVLRYIKPKVVIHTAGLVGGVTGNMREQGRYAYENNVINSNVLEACRQADVKRVLSFLSTCAYPLKAQLPYVESDFHNGLSHTGHYGYAYAKRMLDVMSRAYSEQYKVIYNSIVLSNIYGPFDNYGKESGHVLPSLVHRCNLAKQNNEPFVVWGNGTPLREFIYVKDVIKICYWAIDNFLDTKEPMNISADSQTSIKDLAYMIARFMDFKNEIIFDHSKPNGQQLKPSSTEKFKRLYEDFQFTSLEVGLKETVDWYIRKYNGD